MRREYILNFIQQPEGSSLNISTCYIFMMQRNMKLYCMFFIKSLTVTCFNVYLLLFKHMERKNKVPHLIGSNNSKDLVEVIVNSVYPLVSF